MNQTLGPCKYFTSRFNSTYWPDDCAIGIFAGAGALTITTVVLVFVLLLCCCCCRRTRGRKKRRAHDKETNEDIKLTTIRSNDGGNDDATHSNLERQAQNSRPAAPTSSGKVKKQIPQRKDKGVKQLGHSLDRTSSEGASGRASTVLTKKKAQNQKNTISSKCASEVYRSASYSVVGGTQNDKRLLAISSSGRAKDPSKHDYDQVKGADGDNVHKYANVDLSEETSTNMGIREPKYDEPEKADANSKKNRKANKKGKDRAATTPADRDHIYHTLEESEMIDEEGNGVKDEEEYSSPKRKVLVMSKAGKGQVSSAEENAPIKGVKTKRATSYSEKKSPKNGRKKRDPDYDQPSHDTLPHSFNKDKKGSMQRGNLASIFDDPMYVASSDASASAKITSAMPQPHPRESNPKCASVEIPSVALRKPDRSKLQPEDDSKYDEPNEKKPQALSKKEIYSSKLFDDPKYQETFPN